MMVVALFCVVDENSTPMDEPLLSLNATTNLPLGSDGESVQKVIKFPCSYSLS
ncbi:Uncharacterised protein [Hafnia alvei]|nr:Uncharacterised protein [Hafnia alvei]